MSVEAAEFALTGRVSKAPMKLIHGIGSNEIELLQMDVTVTRYSRSGKATSCPFTVEAWSAAAKQAINRLQPRVGDMVRVTGKLTNFRNPSKKTGRVFENVHFYASTVDAVHVEPDLQAVPQQTAGQRMQEQRERMREYQQQQGAANNGGTYQRGRADVPPTGSAPEELGYGSTSRGYMGGTTAQTEQLQDEDIPF